MQEFPESPVEHRPIHSLLRSRGFWITAVLLVVVLALIFGYVEIRTRDCRLLCGERAGKNARFVVSGGIVRQSDKPVTARCACGG
ncbi:hypothetical protein ACQ859_19630 [Roseateles chitinivorans]|uniref:hypothetical protein n=1 Tax=Roseateles chitinivorans TaxID=2917965 RepID=UPI003D67D505